MVVDLIEVSASMYLATAMSVSASQDGRIRPPMQSGWSGFSMLEIFQRPVPAERATFLYFVKARGGIGGGDLGRRDARRQRQIKQNGERGDQSKAVD